LILVVLLQIDGAVPALTLGLQKQCFFFNSAGLRSFRHHSQFPVRCTCDKPSEASSWTPL